MNVFRGYRAARGEKPRCKDCKGWLPESEGHNRIVCPNCSTPTTYWVD